MKIIESDNITEMYIRALWFLKHFGKEVGNTKEIENMSFVLTNPRSRLILEPLRKHSLRYMKKEILWYLHGSSNIDEISKEASIWQKVSDDGHNVNSNYGMKIFRDFTAGKPQFKMVEEELLRDANSRRAIMFFNMYNEDYMLMHKTKDFPCTVFSQFTIREGKLNMTTHMRSNDIIFGWSNDVPWFTFLQELMAAKLNIPLGTYTHIAGSEHIYERHYKFLDEVNFNYKATPEDKVLMCPFPHIEQKDVINILLDQHCAMTRFLNEA